MEHVLLKAMSRDADSRYSTATEFASALSEVDALDAGMHEMSEEFHRHGDRVYLPVAD